jgi:hypothetical protein
MPAIVRSAALLCLAAVFACADAHDDVMQVISKMAAALTGESGDDSGGARGGNVPEFMSVISKSLPDYDALKDNVTALTRDSEVSSSATPLTENEQGDTYKIDVDWLLQIRSLEQAGPLVRRREIVHCELRKEKKHWKIVALKPVSFFAAANLGNSSSGN